MTEQHKSKKGELWIAIAAFALLVALTLPFVAMDISGRMNKLREQGVVSVAIIESKHFEESRGTKVQAGGGRLVSRNNILQTFTLSFDKHAATKHKDYASGKKLTSKGRPLPYPYTMTVGPEIYARYDEGDTIMITFLSDVASYDKDSFQRTEAVKQQSQFGNVIWLYLISFLLLIVGACAGLRGWKQGKENA
ncbi:MAG: hypothetical protein ABJ360_14915 [Roseobacter sp.]|uniref:hypothetical protein n=2 Tax=Parasphingorhabdus sp. TaxID=2709688 RepID=UPI003266D2CD